MFDLMKEINDNDLVVREDINKLIYILKQKGKQLMSTY
jgi:hypothetical protein